MNTGDLYNELYALGYKRNTVRNYHREILRVQEWLERRGETLEDCSAAVLARFWETLPLKHSQRKMTRAAIVAYWDIVDRRDGPKRTLRVPTPPQGVCLALDEDDAERMLKTARQWCPHEEGPEGVAALTGLREGMRRAEIASMRWDLFGDDGQLTVVGKGDRTRKLPVHPEVAEALNAWRLVRRTPWDPRTRPGSVYVFAGKRGTDRDHVHPETVWEWILKVAEKAGLGRVKPHELRHTFLAEVNDRTGDLRTTQDLAGHARPETTARYTRATDRRKWAAVMSAYRL